MTRDMETVSSHVHLRVNVAMITVPPVLQPPMHLLTALKAGTCTISEIVLQMYTSFDCYMSTRDKDNRFAMASQYCTVT